MIDWLTAFFAIINGKQVGSVSIFLFSHFLYGINYHDH